VTIPTKSLSAVAIKPGVFNEGVINKPGSGNTPQLLPFRSRKEQFIVQNSLNDHNNNNHLNTNHSEHGILKRNLHGPEGYVDPIPQITTFTEKEAEFVNTNGRPSSKRADSRLPKLEPIK